MRELTDIHFPEAEQIRVVLDNLSIHSPAALYSAFRPAEARRVLRRLVSLPRITSARRNGVIRPCEGRIGYVLAAGLAGPAARLCPGTGGYA